MVNADDWLKFRSILDRFWIDFGDCAHPLQQAGHVHMSPEHALGAHSKSTAVLPYCTLTSDAASHVSLLSILRQGNSSCKHLFINKVRPCSRFLHFIALSYIIMHFYIYTCMDYILGALTSIIIHYNAL